MRNGFSLFIVVVAVLVEQGTEKEESRNVEIPTLK